MTRLVFFVAPFALFTGIASASMTFVHPGTLDGKAELDYVKTRVAAKAPPYLFEIQTIKYNEGGLATSPAPQTSIDANSGGADLARNDARRAYGNALMWYLTDDESSAKQAIAYLNAWSGLQNITATNDQNKLVAGWLGSLFAPAADLMLGYPGWDPQDIAKVRAMFKRAFYPVLNTASSWNGNVDLTQIEAMLAISVFNEDEVEFQLGLQRLTVRMPAYFYLATDGKPVSIYGDWGNTPGFWSNPTKWVDGLTQETCRDNNHHAQFAMSAALGAAEIAWHQGVDIYSTYQQRLVAAEELMGLQSFSGDMQGTCTDNAASQDVYDTWEIGYNHYHTRKGLDMPNTWKMISGKVRSYASNPGSWNIFYETLTHADILYSSDLSKKAYDRGHDPATIAIQSGQLRILSNRSRSYEISTFGLNGSRLNQSNVQLAAGESRLVSLGMEHAPKGIYLVRIHSADWNPLFKFSN